jgi:hypothetical protein
MIVRIFSFVITTLFLMGCAAKFLKMENEGQLAKIEEYDEKVKVKTLPVTPEVAQAVTPPSPESTVPTTLEPQPDTKKKKKEKPKPPEKKVEVKKDGKRQPELEDSVGFNGRRPVKDPFWVGEKVTIVLSYFGVKGGDMTMEVRPFVEVNGKKAYHFAATVKSSSIFSTFYSLDDYGETFVDYNDLTPFNFAINVKESGQLREVRSYFDWNMMKSFFWEKKYTKKYGNQEKKLEWVIEPYAHNVFSAAFYLRAFKLEPGHDYKFRVADEERNMVVTAHVLEREKVEVEAGTFDCIKIRPEVQMQGVFQPVGDVFFWLTDDDRHMYVKIEAKIKIGTLKGEAREIIPGVKPL